MSLLLFGWKKKAYPACSINKTGEMACIVKEFFRGKGYSRHDQDKNNILGDIGSLSSCKLSVDNGGLNLYCWKCGDRLREGYFHCPGLVIIIAICCEMDIWELKKYRRL